MAVLSRGFRRARPDRPDGRLPPGQYDVGDDFPVLSAGPTPHTPLASWDLTVDDATGGLARWNWKEFRALPHQPITVDIHCVTPWSKFDTRWAGVAVDTLLEDVEADIPYVLSGCDGGYTTNLLWRTSSTAVPGSWTPLTASRSRRSTAGPSGCSCRTSTSGRAPSGCAGCRCSTCGAPEHRTRG
jgi:hypothetical protein